MMWPSMASVMSVHLFDEWEKICQPISGELVTLVWSSIQVFHEWYVELFFPVRTQEQHNLLNRRQSVQNRHSKKTKVAAAVSAVVTEGSTCSNGSSTSVNATANCAAALGPVDSAEVAATNLPASSVSKDRGDIKCSKNKSSARAKRKHKSNCGTGTADEASRTTAVQDSAEEDSCGLKTSGSKVAIPRLPHSRSPRPTSSSSSATASGGLVLVPGHSASNSPTAAMGSKPKFVPIQPKPSENVRSSRFAVDFLTSFNDVFLGVSSSSPIHLTFKSVYFISYVFFKFLSDRSFFKPCSSLNWLEACCALNTWNLFFKGNFICYSIFFVQPSLSLKQFRQGNTQIVTSAPVE